MTGKYWSKVCEGQPRTAAVNGKKLRKLLDASETAAVCLRSIYELGTENLGPGHLIRTMKALEDALNDDT